MLFHLKLQYADYLLPVELLYRNIHNLDITKEKKEVLKTRKKDCAFSSFNSYNGNAAPLNLTSEEFAALKSLSSNKNLSIQKSDKGIIRLLKKVIISQKLETSYLILVNILKCL